MTDERDLSPAGYAEHNFERVAERVAVDLERMAADVRASARNFKRRHSLSSPIPTVYSATEVLSVLRNGFNNLRTDLVVQYAAERDVALAIEAEAKAHLPAEEPEDPSIPPLDE